MSRNAKVRVIDLGSVVGKSISNRGEIVRAIESSLLNNLNGTEVTNIDVYNTRSELLAYNAGSEDRLVIYAYSSFVGEASGEEFDNLVINGKTTSMTKIKGVLGGEGSLVIKSEEGLPIAEYRSKFNELAILIDIFEEECDEDAIEIFEYIIGRMYELHWGKLKDKNSWVKTSNKEELLENVKKIFKQDINAEIERLRSSVESRKESIAYHTHALKTSHVELINSMNKIDAIESGNSDIDQRIVSDLDLIANNDKVVDVRIEDGCFKVFTDDLYVHNIKTNERHYLGLMEIKINMRDTDVRFYNLNNPRQSYWTRHDPHPHVDGENGRPCLGNVAATIAELCAQKELYALVLTSIDFLENADPTDPAGRRIRNWDMVDEDGNVIKDAQSDCIQCGHCGDEYNEGDMYGIAYYDYDPAEESLYNEIDICYDCRENSFYYSERFDEVIHESIDDEEV